MNDQPIPGPWAFLYDRVVLHWRSSLAGLCGGAAVVIPVLEAQGISAKWIEVAGALALAITAALSKDN